MEFSRRSKTWEWDTDQDGSISVFINYLEVLLWNPVKNDKGNTSTPLTTYLSNQLNKVYCVTRRHSSLGLYGLPYRTRFILHSTMYKNLLNYYLKTSEVRIKIRSNQNCELICL